MILERTTGNLLDKMTPDNLIAKLFPPPDAFVVELKTAGNYQRGTVLSLESDGKYEILGNGSGKPRAVLTDDTDESQSVVTAYRSGHFHRGALHVAADYTMTSADEDELRICGIFLSDAVENDSAFVNGNLRSDDNHDEG